MEIILLERVENLGSIGQLVSVKPGYARNWLLPQKKALRATKSNLAFFEAEKARLLELNAQRRAEAEKLAAVIDGRAVTLVRQASEAGHLYGSVSSRDIAEAANALDIKIDRAMVILSQPIKTLGLFVVRVAVHPEVSVTIKVVVARSLEEAAQTARNAAKAEEKQENAA
ncbi:MAG: 50S ribosomal protein L9 [Alphaproteobacteria bacterium]